MAVDDPKQIAERIAAAEEAGESNLAAELRRHLIQNHLDSPEAKAIAGPGGSQVYATATEPQLVRVVDVDIKFMTMVGLFVKAAIAAIPAAIIVAILYLFFATLL